MPVSIFTQKEFLIESKLNGFWGVLLLLLELALPLLPWSLLTGVCTCLFVYFILFFSFLFFSFLFFSFLFFSFLFRMTETSFF